MNRTNKSTTTQDSLTLENIRLQNVNDVAECDPVAKVARDLSRVDQDLQVALGAIKSVNRLRLRDLFSVEASVDLIDEEQVSCGMDALFRARELSADVHSNVHSLPISNPTRRRLSTPVKQVETEFHSLFLKMSERADPQSLIRDIKKVRRRIPARLIRKLSV